MVDMLAHFTSHLGPIRMQHDFLVLIHIFYFTFFTERNFDGLKTVIGESDSSDSVDPRDRAQTARKTAKIDTVI